jgi:hypothetical protein
VVTAIPHLHEYAGCIDASCLLTFWGTPLLDRNEYLRSKDTIVVRCFSWEDQ